MNKLIKKIALIAILAALSTVLYLFVKFPLPFIFPSFLDVQFSNLPAIIGGFVTGPIGGIIIVLIRFILKLAFSSTAFVGEFADLIIGITVVLTTSLIYRRIRSKQGAVIALVAGTVSWIVMGVIANYFVLVPFYIKLYFGGDINSFIRLLSVIPGVNEQNYMLKYIMFAVIPFNLLLGSSVSALTFIVYRRIGDLFDQKTDIR